MLQGKTRLVKTTTKVSGRVYERTLIHIPSKLAADSQFPFDAGETLRIVVDPVKKMIHLSR